MMIGIAQLGNDHDLAYAMINQGSMTVDGGYDPADQTSSKVGPFAYHQN
jgi:hypothetical protein